MPLGKGRQTRKKLGIAAAAAVTALVFFLVFQNPSGEKAPSRTDTGSQAPAAPQADQPGDIVMGEIEKKPEINYRKLDTDQPLKDLMAGRKQTLGIKKSLDMIVQSDETFTVGKTTVSMKKILEKAFTGQGRVFQEEISESGAVRPTKITEYGIYVVQPGDNIWNIHFRILRDYYGSRGIELQEAADEPGASGMSSGVGKILKFSETMVIIYNMVEEKITRDINLIEPLSKIVVYNMDAVFALLEEISFNNVDRLQFDGQNIWIPAKKR
ncbi:MAG: hypothetical protein HUN04_02085 [Desulfobacter sp.]|nr:MAG: hypothetical protein HUN04_02085 [Desulfobacter sp.]